MKKITLIALMLFTALGYAQVGINTNNPDASSALEIESTTGGILIPRLTVTQRDAISAPATGLMIYQTDQTAGFYFYDGNIWTKVDGVAGPQGTDGVDGTDGTNGLDGAQGDAGPAGVDGQGGITEATYGLTLTGSGTQNDPYLISLPTGGTEGQVLKIENGVPLWADLCSNIYYRDLDGDSYGNNLDSITFCDPPVGYVIDNTDCDDSDASIHPGATEIDDDIDNNCDGVIDEGFNEPSNCDGIPYPSIVYGTQQWTVENACHTTYRDGTLIPHVTDTSEWADLTTGAWTYYDNNLEKGKLYNWYAIMGIHDTDPNTPNKEFVPEGWHVPTDAEWTTLENYLIANGYNYDPTTITTYNKLAKAMASTTGWNSSTSTGVPGNNQSLNNSSGFNSFPEGFRYYYGSFSNEGFNAYFWSSTEDNVALVNFALGRVLGNDYSTLTRNYNYKEDGFSVRFVRD